MPTSCAGSPGSRLRRPHPQRLAPRQPFHGAHLAPADLDQGRATATARRSCAQDLQPVARRARPGPKSRAAGSPQWPAPRAAGTADRAVASRQPRLTRPSTIQPTVTWIGLRCISAAAAVDHRRLAATRVASASRPAARRAPAPGFQQAASTKRLPCASGVDRSTLDWSRHRAGRMIAGRRDHVVAPGCITCEFDADVPFLGLADVLLARARARRAGRLCRGATGAAPARPPPRRPASHVVDGTPEQAFARARADNRPVFLYWSASWCPPCHELKAHVFFATGSDRARRAFVTGLRRW